MKNKLILGLIMVLLTALSAAGQTNGKHTTARIYEGGQIKDFARIVVVYETGDSRIIPLKDYSGVRNTEGINAILIENLKIINKFFDEMSDKNYEILAMTSTNLGTAEVTYVSFRKKEK